MKYQYIISLGDDCFGRTLIDRFNLREKFPVRMPFDGSSHPYQSVCELINNGFKEYGEDVYYAHNSFISDKYNIRWNHEKTTDKTSFLSQIKKRVDQFNHILNTANGILFILNHNTNDIHFDSNLLNNIIHHKYPHLRFHILVLNNFLNGYYKNVNDNITYLNIYWNPDKKLYGDMVNDFMNQIYSTPYGKHFCHLLINEICLILDENPSKYIYDDKYDFITN